MRVVLGEPTHTSQPVHDSGFLVAVVVAQFVEPQRQVSVGAPPGAEDEIVHRAVHGLEVVLLAGLGDVALGVTLLVGEHRGEHRVRVVRQVPRGVEETALGDLGGVDEVESGSQVALGDVVLDDVAQDATLGVEQDEPRTDLLGEGVEIEFGTELAVITPGGLGHAGLVGDEIRLGCPGRAVDALQLVVGLVALPVGGRRLRQGEAVAQILGGGHVRAPAEILPGRRPVPPDVVIDGEFGSPDLHRRTLGLMVALGADEFEFVRLVGELDAGLLLGRHTTHEALVLLDDALHALLEILHDLWGDCADVAEVIVETVGDERPDTQVDVGVQFLDGLGHDVGAGMPDDVEPVLTGGEHGFDDVTVLDLTLQVEQGVCDAHGHDITISSEQVQTSGSGVHHVLLLLVVPNHGDGDGHVDLPFVKPRAYLVRGGSRGATRLIRGESLAIMSEHRVVVSSVEL